jgi:tetratricopeptide (TPR) repeat protein
MIMKYIYIFISIVFMLMSKSVFAHSAEHLGQIAFPTTGKPAAQPLFEKGVMLLHSFQYEDARASFRRAEKMDGNFSLAYWGEAMTYNHPLWGEQDYDKAVTALKRFAETPEERIRKSTSAKEKGYINAVNQLYGSGYKSARDERYLLAMLKLYQQFPEDEEIAILYSLALLGTTEAQRDERVYMQAASIAEDVYEKNKQHPGALHYIIHAFDDPIHAALGLRAARSYAEVAPSASHALHMPSHIFNALGLWDDVIKSNQAAWVAGVEENKDNNTAAYTLHDLHALQWLSYAYLQKKNYAQALELNKIMENIAITTSSPMAIWYYSQMRAAYLEESKDYGAALISIEKPQAELSALASNAYANMLVAKNQGTIGDMKAILKHLVETTPAQVPNKTYPDYFTSVTKSGIMAAKIVALEIEAQIAFCQKQYQQAIRLLRRATVLEDKVSFGYGPPIPIKPTFEMLAELLMQCGQFKEAYEQYVITLNRLPNRIQAVNGLQQAKLQLQALHLPMPAGIKSFFHRLMLPEFFH